MDNKSQLDRLEYIPAVNPGNAIRWNNAVLGLGSNEKGRFGTMLSKEVCEVFRQKGLEMAERVAEEIETYDPELREHAVDYVHVLQYDHLCLTEIVRMLQRTIAGYQDLLAIDAQYHPAMRDVLEETRWAFGKPHPRIESLDMN